MLSFTILQYVSIYFGDQMIPKTLFNFVTMLSTEKCNGPATGCFLAPRSQRKFRFCLGSIVTNAYWEMLMQSII